jgi:hypothetical protein
MSSAFYSRFKHASVNVKGNTQIFYLMRRFLKMVCLVVEKKKALVVAFCSPRKLITAPKASHSQNLRDLKGGEPGKINRWRN